MNSLSFLLVILLINCIDCFVKNRRESNYCYANNTNPYLLMGTRTGYENVRGNMTRLSPDSDCKPVQVWGLLRHGARYPNRDVVKKLASLVRFRDKILKNHDERAKGELCKADLESLRSWEIVPEPSAMTPRLLTVEGKREQENIAKRLRAMFPELLQNVRPADYKFRATDEQRTRASMRAFMRGLFDGDEKKVQPEQTPMNDSLLYTYKNCPTYASSLKNDPIVNLEVGKFTAGPEITNLVTAVSERLGFDTAIDLDTVLLAYEICRFEKAWQRAVSPWCAAFSTEDIKALEYQEDIGCYYYCGPGRKINEMLGCPQVQDLIRHFRNVNERTKNEPKGIFYFTHTVTLQAAMAAMGIGNDGVPLLSTNYESMKNRTFRTSLIGPFTGNIVAVFYKCNGKKSSNKVMLYVSERLWKFEECDDGVCDWDAFERKFGGTADRCNLDFCYH